MTGQQLSHAFRSGQRVYGTLIVSDSPRWPETVAKIGLDFVFIDTEHIAIDRKTLSWMCQAYRAVGLPALVRITAPDPYEATCVLDAGACGVVAPYVETVAQVRALRAAVKLRPLKGARAAAIVAGEASPEPLLADYIAAGCAENLLVINIESTPALAALPQLVREPGVDAVLIGPHDLSSSLGVPERYEDPRFEAAVRDIFRTARLAGIGAGIHSWMGVEREVAWATGPHGANLIIHEADIISMRLKIADDLTVLRTRLGDVARARASADNI